MTLPHTIQTALKAIVNSFSGIFGWEISQHNIISLVWRVSNFSTYYLTLNNDSPLYSSNRLKSICLFVSRHLRVGNTSASLYLAAERGRQIAPPIFRPEIITPSIYFLAVFKSISDWFSKLSGLEINRHHLIWQLRRWVEFHPYISTLDYDCLSFFFSSMIKSRSLLIFIHLRCRNMSASPHLTIEQVSRISPPTFRP